MSTNDALNLAARASLAAAGWVTRTDIQDLPPFKVEDWQRKTYWYSNAADKVGIHLLLKEDLTNAEGIPHLYIYTKEDGYREIKTADLS